MSSMKAGTLASIIAGTIFGLFMQMTSAPTPSGSYMPLMAMVAQIVHSNSLLIGWLYHLFNSAVIGAVFGWLIGDRLHGYSRGLVCGVLYGALLWVLGGLIMMPILLGMPPFAPLSTALMRMTAMASLMGHIIYGVVLGISFTYLTLGASYTRLVRKKERGPHQAATLRRI